MRAARGLAPHLRGLTRGSILSLLGVTAVALAVFGMLYNGLPLILLPAGVAGAALILTTLRSPTLGMSFVIAAEYVPVQMAGLTPFQIVGVLVAVLCLSWFAIHKRGILFPSIVLPIIVTVFLSLYALSFTRDAILTGYSVRKLISNAIFCLLFVNAVDSYRKLWVPLWTLVGVGLVNSVAAALQFSTRGGGDYRATGLLENENQLGAVAAVAFIITFYHFLYARERWKRLGNLALCGILSAGIVTSISRGVILALVVAVCYMALREKRHRRAFLIFGILVLAGLPFLPRYFVHRFSNIGDEVKGTIFVGTRTGLSTRGYFNKAGLKIWKANPWLGVGLGSYGYYFIQPEFNPGLRASHRLPPHNIYLQALAEMGVVGFVVLMWWILQAAFNYWVAERRAGGNPQAQIYLRACETLTIFLLVAFASGGNLVQTNLAIMITLSAVCRRCSEVLASEEGGEDPQAILLRQ